MMEKQTKVCNKCKQERVIDKFPLTKSLTRGHICMFCIYDREKEKLSASKKFWLDDWIYKE